MKMKSSFGKSRPHKNVPRKCINLSWISGDIFPRIRAVPLSLQRTGKVRNKVVVRSCM